MTSQACPDDDRLTAFAAGSLNGDALEQIIEHVDHCDRCQSRFETLDDTSRSLPSIAENLQRLRHHEGEKSTETIAQLLLPRRSSGSAAGPPAFPVPERIGPYAIIRKIASGGMGVVYEARHVNLGRSVALKLLRHQTAAGDDAGFSRPQAEQVLREWRAHGQLAHPNIVTATDAGLCDGQPYLVTELVNGADLSQIVKHAGPLSIHEVARIGRDVATAINHAHGQGIAHLDIKPSNVMIDHRGVVKVLDMGTAQSVHADKESNLSSRAPGVEGFGTLDYLAPERVREISNPTQASEQPFASDVYSLGCTLHYLLAGNPPFDVTPQERSRTNRVAEILRAHRQQPPPNINFQADQGDAALAQALQSLIHRMLAKDPTDRPSSMRKISEALVSIVQSAKTDTEKVECLSCLLPPSPVTLDALSNSGQTVGLTDLLPESKPGNRRFAWGASGLALLTAALLAAWAWLPASDTTEPAQLDTTSTSPTAVSTSPTAVASTANPSNYVVDVSTGLLHRSDGLLQLAQSRDASVVATSIRGATAKTVVKRLRWSPSGKQLALLTNRSQMYLYRWRDNRISLQSIWRHPTSNEILDFAWSANGNALIIGSESGEILRLTCSERGNFQRELLTSRPGRIGQIGVLNDGGRELLVRQLDRRIDWIDVASNSYLADAPEHDNATFAVSNDSRRVAMYHNDTVLLYQVGYDQQRWDIELVGQQSSDFDPDHVRITYSQDDSYIAVCDREQLSIFGGRSLEPLFQTSIRTYAYFDFGVCFAAGSTKRIDGEKSSPLLTMWIDSGFGIARHELFVAENENDEASPSFRWESNDSMFGSGDSLTGSLLAEHPHEPVCAIANIGQLVIAGSSFEVIDQIAGIARFGRVTTMQNAPVTVMMRDNGAVHFLNDETGQPIGEAVPPSPDLVGLFVQRQAISEPNQTLHQSSQYWPDRTKTRVLDSSLGIPEEYWSKRSLTIVPAGIDLRMSRGVRYDRPEVSLRPATSSDALTSIEDQLSEDYWYGPSVCFSDNHERMLHVDESGSLHLYDLASGADSHSEPLVGHGKYSSVAMRNDVAYVASSIGSRDQRVTAVILDGFKVVWTADLPRIGSSCTVTPVADNRLVISAFESWRLLDASTGEQLALPHRPADFGVDRQMTEASHVSDGYTSWSNVGIMFPIVRWDEVLRPKWFAHAIGTDGLAVISDEGRLTHLRQNSADQATCYRRIKDGAIANPIEGSYLVDAANALTWVWHHQDGRVTLHSVRELGGEHR